MSRRAGPQVSRCIRLGQVEERDAKAGPGVWAWINAAGKFSTGEITSAFFFFFASNCNCYNHALSFPNGYILKCFVVSAHQDDQRITVSALGPGGLVIHLGEARENHSKEGEGKESSSDSFQRSALGLIILIFSEMFGCWCGLVSWYKSVAKVQCSICFYWC